MISSIYGFVLSMKKCTKCLQETLNARFDNKWAKDSSGCWLWHGSISSTGYGNIKFKGKVICVHRYAYERWVDIIPDGLYVCHTCDTRNCINPDHLFLGTHKDNMEDMTRKGRRCGELNSSSKLTEKNVKEILASPPGSTKELAKKYKIHRSTVNAIKAGKLWGHVKASRKR